MSALVFCGITQATENPTAVGVSTFHVLEFWDEEFESFSNQELRPPILSLQLEGSFNREIVRPIIESQLSVTPHNMWSIYLNPGLERTFNKGDLLVAVRSELSVSNLTQNKTYKDTLVDYFLYGFNYHFKYKYKDSWVYFKHFVRSVSDTQLADQESSRTKLRHGWDNIYKIGVESKFNQFDYMLEIARFKFGSVKILSNEFSYIIDSAFVDRFGGGLGYHRDKYTYWLKFFSYGPLSDEISHYYQAPFFTPDYTLAKRFIQLEVKWDY